MSCTSFVILGLPHNMKVMYPWWRYSTMQGFETGIYLQPANAASTKKITFSQTLLQGMEHRLYNQSFKVYASKHTMDLIGWLKANPQLENGLYGKRLYYNTLEETSILGDTV
jgi:hypothetical protein